MNRREDNSASIPFDLTVEIFLRLPAKSIARFRCVSKKLCGSMLHCPYFTELFLTRSLARPRLLLALKRDGKLSFFSLPQPQPQPHGKSSSLVVTADFQTKFSKDMGPADFCGLTSGLIYFSSMRILGKKGAYAVPVIFNPITGQYASLPKLTRYRKSYNFLGFHPIDKKFKVLSIDPYSNGMEDQRILTLGAGELCWRKIQCPLTHDPYFNQKICINGVLYYLADIDGTSWIVCFDVRSEKFKFIEADFFCATLINYKGKLGGIKWNYDGHGNTLELRMWVLEDVEKNKWSNFVYTLPGNKIKTAAFLSYHYFLHSNRKILYVVGVTATGEIVLTETYTNISKPLCVFYFNPERNTFQRVEIRGFGEYCDQNRHRVFASVDYVEDLNAQDAKYLKSSQSINIIRKLPKPQKSCNSTLSLKNNSRE